eukprot:TRINITY_DN10916_c0_g1_i2.p1 TRINITY_DN10916_c0_g1~~TRINITY_DN10916_c0_g1_i2.p1  ORF type:complete len:152 (+),score=1.12 TRINITY_DN10916_c0_g1_i2:6-461(+)
MEISEGHSPHRPHHRGGDPHDHNQDVAVEVLRCNILEATSGVCLFDKTWSWEAKSAAGDISNLILTFVKIAGQLGEDDEVNHVLFTKPTQNVTTRKITRRRAKPLDESQIRLAIKKGSGIVVGVFHRQPKIRSERVRNNVKRVSVGLTSFP